MIYCEISFPLTFILRYIFVKILLLMTFIYIYISLKTSNILENKSQVFERVIAQLHNDLYYNGTCNLNETQQRYHIKSKNFK